MHDEAWPDWDPSLARATIAEHASEEGPLLVVLQALQHVFGHVPEDAVPLVAETR